jgi:hypothetical protein
MINTTWFIFDHAPRLSRVEFGESPTRGAGTDHADHMLDGPFRGTEARTRGLLTRGELYGPRFRRLFPDVFAPAELEPTLLIRSMAAYLLVEGIGGVLGGYSAARLSDIDCAPHTAVAEVLVPRYVRARPDLAVRFGTPAESDIATVRGCRVTTPLCTSWDLGRRLPLVEAVVALDALAHGGAFDPAELLVRRTERPGARGSRGLDAAVALADPRAESPMETRLRLAIVQAGLPRPEVQYRVMDDDGYPLTRVDLAYPDVRLALEYDGEHHFDRRQGERDRRRDSLLAGCGWETMRLTSNDMGPELPHTVRQITDLRAFRARR